MEIDFLNWPRAKPAIVMKAITSKVKRAIFGAQNMVDFRWFQRVTWEMIPLK